MQKSNFHQKSVALLGRPNVGKSRLFNRLVGKRISIVHDQPGITRDVIAEDAPEGYTVLDTGGIGYRPEMTSEAIHAATEEQVDFALQAASVILFVIDAKEGLTTLDHEIAEHLRQYGKTTLLIANKIDNVKDDATVLEATELGFGSPISVSAEHNIGLTSLKATILELVGPIDKPESTQSDIAISLAGRPNVGKSSLGNQLLHSQRLIVSDVAGTTRDAIRTQLKYDHEGEPVVFRLIDTAGLKAKKKIQSSVEYFSCLRSSGAIQESDVVFLILDAQEGITRFEQQLAGDIAEFGKSAIIVVNKWDYALEAFENDPPPEYKNIKEFQGHFEKAIRKELYFLHNVPIIFTSAKTEFNVEQILKEAIVQNTLLDKHISTGELNKVIAQLIEKNPPKRVHGRRFKVYYVVQTGNRPFSFRFYCNRGTKLDDNYKRYLLKGIHRAFQLRGAPVKLELFGKSRRYSAKDS